MKNTINALFGVVFFFILPSPSFAKEAEASLKAAFIYRFCHYVQWPEAAFRDTLAPIIIGVYGSQSHVDEVEHTVQGRTLSGRGFIVRKMDRYDQINDLHVLYLAEKKWHFDRSDDDSEDVFNDFPVLVISDKGAPLPISIIHFRKQDNRIRFEISHSRAEAVGLKVSSQLLSLALRVN